MNSCWKSLTAEHGIVTMPTRNPRRKWEDFFTVPVYIGWCWLQNRTKMPTGARTKGRWAHLSFVEFQLEEDADGWKQKNLKKVRVDDDVVEGTSGRLGGSWPNKSGPTKARERLSQILEGEERIGNEPKQTRNMRRQTAPPQSPTSGSRTSINNHGSGTIYNRDVGNTYNPTLTNVANQLEPRRNISKSSNWFPISFGLKFP